MVSAQGGGGSEASSLRRRLLAQQWAVLSIDHLLKQVVVLLENPLERENLQSRIVSLSLLMDKITAAGRTAARNAHVLEMERRNIVAEIERVKGMFDREENEVLVMRQRVKCEKEQADFRAQYDGICKLIVGSASRKESEDEMVQVKKQSIKLDEDAKAVQKMKDYVNREVELLSHSAALLERFAKELNGGSVRKSKASESENGRGGSADAMDTS